MQVITHPLCRARALIIMYVCVRARPHFVRRARLLHAAFSASLVWTVAKRSSRLIRALAPLIAVVSLAGSTSLNLRIWAALLGAFVRVLAAVGFDPLGKLGISKFSHHGQNIHIVVAGSE